MRRHAEELPVREPRPLPPIQAADTAPSGEPDAVEEGWEVNGCRLSLDQEHCVSVCIDPLKPVEYREDREYGRESIVTVR
jgi:hypothetical protein